MTQRFHDGQTGILQFHILAHNPDGDIVREIPQPIRHFLPFPHIRLRCLDFRQTAYGLIHSLLMNQQGHLIYAPGIQGSAESPESLPPDTPPPFFRDDRIIPLPLVTWFARVRFSLIKRSSCSMYRSASAPSSVTNTSPCQQGFTVRDRDGYWGSKFPSGNFQASVFEKSAQEAAVIPFQREDPTLPVTKSTSSASPFLLFLIAALVRCPVTAGQGCFFLPV